MNIKDLLKITLVFVFIISPAIISQMGSFSGTAIDISYNIQEGSVQNRIFYILVFFINIFLIVKYKFILIWDKIIIFFIIYLLCGVLYSNQTLLVIRGTIVFIITFSFWTTVSQLMALKFDTKKVLYSFIFFCLLYGIVEYTLWYFDYDKFLNYGEMSNYIGFLQQPNLVAKILCLGLIVGTSYLIYYNQKIKYLYMYIIANTLLIFLLFKTGSRTALFSLIISILVGILSTKEVNFLKKLFILFLMIMSAFIFYNQLLIFVLKVDMHYLNILEYESIFIRRYIWEITIREVLKSPFIGYGLNTFWIDIFLRSYNYPIAGVHNGLLNVLQDLGLIGLGFYILMYYKLIRPIFVVNLNSIEDNFILKKILLQMWIFFIIVNITEGDFGNIKSSLWGLVTVFTLYFYFKYFKKPIEIKLKIKS